MSPANEQEEEKLKLLFSEYAAEDVFNTGEVVVFNKILSEKTLAL